MAVTNTTQREGFTPEGCIATISPQSAHSSELVIEALARELSAVTDLLFRACELHIHDRHAPEEAKHECPYWQGWARANDLLVDLQDQWPHLNV